MVLQQHYYLCCLMAIDTKMPVRKREPETQEINSNKTEKLLQTYHYVLMWISMYRPVSFFMKIRQPRDPLFKPSLKVADRTRLTLLTLDLQTCWEGAQQLIKPTLMTLTLAQTPEEILKEERSKFIYISGQKRNTGV